MQFEKIIKPIISMRGMRADEIRNYNFSCIYSSDGPGEIERNRERRIIESQRRAVIGVMSSFSDAQSNGKYISARANTLGVYFFCESVGAHAAAAADETHCDACCWAAPAA
jgi:hypothetical protein